MKDGYIQQVGTPQEVFEMPDNLFVGEFIGAPKMNTFKTTLINEGGKYYVTPFGSKIEVTGEKAEKLKEKNIQTQEIILGVRPEHIILRERHTDSAIECTLEVNEMMGSELYLHLDVEGDKIVVRVPTINLTTEERNNLVFGKKLNISFEGKVMHFFDVETEKNLLV